AGMLGAQQVRGRLELALGLHRDPEMGLVVMAGAGGVLLELTKDVAFCAPPISRDKARDMLKRTRVARLIEGYRGSEPRDVGAIIDALVGLGRLAVDCPDEIMSVDIDPFAALAKGGMALDALAVCRRRWAENGGEGGAGSRPVKSGDSCADRAPDQEVGRTHAHPSPRLACACRGAAPGRAGERPAAAAHGRRADRQQMLPVPQPGDVA